MRCSEVVQMLLCICVTSAVGQSSTPAPLQLSPQAAYDRATRPFDLVRRSPKNWSDIELAALKAATAQAKSDCISRSPDQFTGEDVLAYARLCALGQEWKPVQEAASRYLQLQQVPTPAARLTALHSKAIAFDYEVQASLRMEDSEGAVLAARSMLKTVPYDALTSEATSSTLQYIQLSHPDQALALLNQRQPILLSAIQAQGLPNSSTGSAADPALTLHDLYADAVALPAMQQFTNQQGAAAASFSTLEATMPSVLSPEDAAPVSQTRRRYLLLGSHVPAIKTLAWLPPGTVGPDDLYSNFGDATVFLLFPDWCNQCVALGPTFNPASRRLLGDGVRFFALLAQADPPPKTGPKDVTGARGANRSRGSQSTRVAPFPDEKPDTPRNELVLEVKSNPAALLVGTPTFVVPTDTLSHFAAEDFPLIVVIDHDGMIRSIQVAPENVLTPGGLMDQIVTHVVHTCPPSKPQ